MKTKVRITANPKTGEVFTLNANLGKDGQQYGFIRLEQNIIDMKNPVGNIKTVSTLKTFLAKAYDQAKSVLVAGTEMEGTIVRKETTDPEIHKNGEKSGYAVKRAGKGENAPICKVGNLPIYQSTEFSEDANAADTLIQHTNVDEIKAYQAALVAEGTIN